MKQVKKFIKEFNITSENLNIKTLEEIIKNQGYEIYDFGADEEKVNAILKKLNLEEVSKSKNAFTYSSNTIKAVFINKNVGITERTELLLHEEIHIYLGHLNNTTLENEEEVLRFSTELKKQLKLNNLTALISIFTIFAIIVVVIVILITTNTTNKKNTTEPIQSIYTSIVEVTISNTELTTKHIESITEQTTTQIESTTNETITTIPEETTTTEETTTSSTSNLEEVVYITKKGNKYHKKNCYIIKNHEVIEMPKEQAEQLYEPCKICYPED